MGIIRFLLALAIVNYHADITTLPRFLNNNTVVAAFFVISGFSISYTLSHNYSFNRQGLIAYYKKRFTRIYPLYYIALIFSIIVGILVSSTSVVTSMTAAIKQFQGASLLRQAHYVFENVTLCNGWHAWIPTPGTMPLIVLPAWTLLVEWWFYLLAPFIHRLRSKWILCLMVFSMICRFVTYHHSFGLNSLPDNQFFPNQLIYFLIGIMSYRYGKYVTATNLRIKQTLLGILSCVIILGQFISPIGATHWLFLFVLATILPSIQSFDLHDSKIKFFGKMSYPLFLFHLPIIWLIEAFIMKP